MYLMIVSCEPPRQRGIANSGRKPMGNLVFAQCDLLLAVFGHSVLERLARKPSN